jgi:hypothetical protein
MEPGLQSTSIGLQHLKENFLYREWADLTDDVSEARKNTETADHWVNRYLTVQRAEALSGAKTEEDFWVAPPLPPPPSPPPARVLRSKTIPRQ